MTKSVAERIGELQARAKFDEWEINEILVRFITRQGDDALNDILESHVSGETAQRINAVMAHLAKSFENPSPILYHFECDAIPVDPASLEVGQEVYWCDANMAISSGLYTITAIADPVEGFERDDDTIVHLRSGDTHISAHANELV